MSYFLLSLLSPYVNRLFQPIFTAHYFRKSQIFNIRLDGEIKDFQTSQFHNELNTKIAKQGASHHWPEER